MQILIKTPLVVLMCVNSFILAQKGCSLGVGGKHHDKIIETFDLTEEQQKNLRNWGAELEFRNSIYKQQANRLLRQYDGKTHEDLVTLAADYKALLDKMRANAKMVDKRMLGTFTKKQYRLYVKLCRSLLVRPMYVSVTSVD